MNSKLSGYFTNILQKNVLSKGIVIFALIMGGNIIKKKPLFTGGGW